MRIAFDAKRALNNISGLGNYSRTLLNGLMLHFPEHEFLLFSPRVNDNLLNLLQGDFSLVLPEKQMHKTIHPLWRSFGLKRQLVKSKAAIYHGLSNELPFNSGSFNMPKMVTIHDVLFLHHPEDFPLADRTIYHLKTSFACKHADIITVNSFQTKNDLIEKLGVSEKKIEVVHHAVGGNFLRAISEDEVYGVREKYQLPERFILQTGSFLGRKNHLLTLRAFKEIAHETDLHLVFAGSGGNHHSVIKNEIAHLQLHDKVHIISTIANIDMPAVCKAAAMLVYPSLNEGFGLPILEGFATGTPVITTAGKCFAEVGGDAAFYISSSSATELAEMMMRVMNDKEVRDEKILLGSERVKNFTAENLARGTMKLYESIV